MVESGREDGHVSWGYDWIVRYYPLTNPLGRELRRVECGQLESRDLPDAFPIANDLKYLYA